MYRGQLWLCYSDEENKASYQGKISRFIKRDLEISFDFHGSDCDEGPFSGNCKVNLKNDRYIGTGEFRYSDGETINAYVEFSIEEEGHELYLWGEWKDDGSAIVYSLDAELSE